MDILWFNPGSRVYIFRIILHNLKWEESQVARVIKGPLYQLISTIPPLAFEIYRIMPGTGRQCRMLIGGNFHCLKKRKQ